MRRHAPLLASVLTLAGLVALVVSSILRPSEVPFERDLLDFFLPMKAVYARCLSGGDVPWWDPWTLGGQPFFANLQSQVLYPGNLLFLGVTLPWALSLSSALHLALAGAGAAALAGVAGASWPARLLAAAGTAGGGMAVSLVCLHNQLCTFAWLPWALAAALSYAGHPSTRALAGWAAALALALLGGEPQLALLGGIASGALALAAGRGRRVSLAGAAVLVALLVGCACAVQLGPFAELVLASDRVTGDWAQAGRHALSLEALASLVIAPSAAQPAPAGAYVHSLFVGPVLLVLALGAVATRARRDAMTLAWTLLAAASILLALGPATPLGRAALEATPFLRFPVKYVFLAALALPQLAASGLDLVQEGLRSRTGRGRLVAAAAWLAAIATAAQLGLAHRDMVPSLPADALLAPTPAHRLLAAQTRPDGPRVHAAPLTLERLERRARRVAAGDLAGAMRERVDLLEGGLPAVFGICSTWGGVALSPRAQAERLERVTGPDDPALASSLHAGFILDDASRMLALPMLPVDGGAARLYVLPQPAQGLAREWLSSSECVGAPGLPAPSQHPGWREVEPGHWRFRPTGLLPLGILSAATWLALAGAALRRPSRRDVASAPPRL